MDDSNGTEIIKMVEPAGGGYLSDHGGIGRAYSSWDSARRRCLYPTATGYEYYGGRGIGFCERWLSFDSFLEDMGPRPKGKTLDRINVDGNYEPGNCRWATWTEQQNNKRNNIKISLDDEEKTLGEWVQETGIKKETIKSRLRLNKNTEEVLNPNISTGGRNRQDNSALIGQPFGYLTVLDVFTPPPTITNQYPHQRVVCECVCGKIKDYDICNVVSNRNTNSCGCRGKGIAKIDGVQAGETFGEWEVIKGSSGQRGKTGPGRECLCRCSCGVIKDVSIYSLRHGNSTNCGHKFIKHASASRGSEYYKEYKSWDSMKSACYNPNNKTYKNIGAKSIKVCERWVNSFENFMVDMGKRPEGKQLNRRDRNADYSPENCFWGTRTKAKSCGLIAITDK